MWNLRLLDPLQFTHQTDSQNTSKNGIRQITRQYLSGQTKTDTYLHTYVFQWILQQYQTIRARETTLFFVPRWLAITISSASSVTIVKPGTHTWCVIILIWSNIYLYIRELIQAYWMVLCPAYLISLSFI